MYLEKVAPECQDILRWPGKAGIAMGVRRLDKGKVITMGTPMSNAPDGWVELLAWCGVSVPATPTAPGCRVAHFVSNNGLYDVYVVWAQDRESTKGRGTLLKGPATVTLTVPGTQATMVSVLTGVPVTGKVVGDKVEFAGLKVEPLETYAFLAPRRAILTAPLAWLKLQRDWWKGTKRPAPAPEIKPHRNTLSLDADWAFLPLPAQLKDAQSLVGPAVDDSSWTRMDIGVWYGPKFPDTKRGVFRKRFTVPADWNGRGESGSGYVGQVRATPRCRRTRCRSSWTVNR